MRTIGYARCSTSKQDLENQVELLYENGAEYVYADESYTGRNPHRPELAKLILKVREGDVIIVQRLDRMGRTLVDLINMVQKLKQIGVVVRDLHHGITYDTEDRMGKMMLFVIGMFAEMEGDLARDRNLEMQAIARARGKKIGRKRIELDITKIEEYRNHTPPFPWRVIGSLMKCSAATAKRRYEEHLAQKELEEALNGTG